MPNSIHQTNRKWDLFVSYSRTDNNAIKVTLGDKELGVVEAFIERLQQTHLQFTGNKLEIFFDKNSIEDDEYWSDKLREGVRDSALFLAFLSPNYKDSDYCLKEWKEYVRFQHANARGQSGIKQIYVVTIDELEARENPSPEHERYEFINYMRSLQRNPKIDIRDLAKDPNALSRALQVLDTEERLEDIKLDLYKIDTDISERLDKVFLAELAEQHSSWSSVLKTFVGRSQEIRALHKIATQSEVGVVGSVHGLGGQGKTALVSQYAHAYSGYYAYGGRWLIPCEGIKSLAEAFDQLPALLNYKLEKEQESLQDGQRIQAHLGFIVASMRRRAEQIEIDWKSKRGKDTKIPEIKNKALIVLDNVDQPGLLDASVLQNIEGLGKWLSLIATTRLDISELGSVNQSDSLTVEDLPIDDRLALLRAFRDIPYAEETLAKELVTLTGGITILVEIIAASIKAEEKLFKRRSLRETLELKIETLKQSGIFSIDDMGDKVKYELRAKNRQLKLSYIVEDSLNTLIQPIGDQDAIAPEAESILSIASQFPADLVVEDWLFKLVNQANADIDKASFEESLSILEGRRLITRGDTTPYTAKIHRDIRAYFTEYSKYNNNETFNKLVILYQYELNHFVSHYREDVKYRQWRNILVNITFYILEQYKLRTSTGDFDIFDLCELAVAEQDFGVLSKAINLAEIIHALASNLLQNNPNSTSAQRDVSLSQYILGDFYLDRGIEGDAELALQMYKASLSTRETILKNNPRSDIAKRDVSMSQNKLGDFYSARGIEGDAELALQMYKASLSAKEAILKSNPNSTNAQRDVSVAQEALGNFYSARGIEGDAELALHMYKATLSTSEAILKNNPNSSIAKRDVSLSQNSLGNFYSARGIEGDAELALQMYKASLSTSEAILKNNPNSSIAQRDVSITQERLGDFYKARGIKGDAEMALQTYKASLSKSKAILKNNPNSSIAKRDVSVTQEKLGDFYKARGIKGDAELALQMYKSSLSICESILKNNPYSSNALRDVSVLQNSIGDFYMARGIEGDAELALQMYKASLSTREAILKNNPNSLEVIKNLEHINYKIADLYKQRNLSTNDLILAIAFYDESIHLLGKSNNIEFSLNNLYVIFLTLEIIGDCFLKADKVNYLEDGITCYKGVLNGIDNVKSNLPELPKEFKAIEQRVKDKLINLANNNETD